jgi:hypothetical protein
MPDWIPSGAQVDGSAAIHAKAQVTLVGAFAPLCALLACAPASGLTAQAPSHTKKETIRTMMTPLH